jgi:hypothetical protein
MQNDDNDTRKYVFVCGQPRSGTSVLYRNIARFENCTGFENTPASVPREGQFIQDVYPTGRELGGPGRIGFDARAHQTEASSWLTPEKIARLKASWHAHWDNSKTICVEKTPWNLLMTRFLQAAFPNSYFIVTKRHPIPVSLGTQRMANARPTSLHQLFEHWLLCQRTFDEDKKHLHRVYELTYEDYVADPARYHQEIAAFIGTSVPEGATEEVNPTQSNKYFDQWLRLLTNSRFKSYYLYIARKYEPRFAAYGYSLTNFQPDLQAFCEDRGVSPTVGALSCVAADSYAFARRAATWPALYLKQQAKAHLPQPIVARIKAARQRKPAGR